MITCSTIEIHKILVDILATIDTPIDVANKVAESLILNELCGYPSHGILRILQYVKDAKKKSLHVMAKPVTQQTSEQIIHIDGNRSFGILVVEKIIECLALCAKNQPLVTVRVTNSHHVGRLNAIGLQLASPPHNLFVIGFCNYLGRGARVAPPGQRSHARLCTNPMLMAFPVENSAPFVLDMSTTIISEGHVAHARALGKTLPLGVLINQNEEAVTDPHSLYADVAKTSLAPLGFPLGSHKGYGMAVFVEAMIGVLAGANTISQPGDEGNGLFILALNPLYFACQNDFATRAADIVKLCYQSDNEQESFRYPGLNSVDGSSEIWDKVLTIPLTTYHQLLKI